MYLQVWAVFLLKCCLNMNRDGSERNKLRKLSVWGIKNHRSAAVRRGSGVGPHPGYPSALQKVSCLYRSVLRLYIVYLSYCVLCVFQTHWLCFM